MSIEIQKEGRRAYLIGNTYKNTSHYGGKRDTEPCPI